LTYGECRQRAREGDWKAAHRGRKTARNAKKMLNRGNELKHLLKTQHLASFEAKNELKTNWILSAKSAKNREQGTEHRGQGTEER
jgi:dsDNA-binding SOS-regulon protein